MIASIEVGLYLKKPMKINSLIVAHIYWGNQRIVNSNKEKVYTAYWAAVHNKTG